LLSESKLGKRFHQFLVKRYLLISIEKSKSEIEKKLTVIFIAPILFLLNAGFNFQLAPALQGSLCKNYEIQAKQRAKAVEKLKVYPSNPNRFIGDLGFFIYGHLMLIWDISV